MIREAAEKARKILEHPVNKALDAIAGWLSETDSLGADEMQILALFKAILPQDPEAAERARAQLQNNLERQGADQRHIQNILHFLDTAAPGSVEDALSVLKRYNRERQQKVLSSFLQFSIERGAYRKSAHELVKKLALALGFTEKEFTAISDDVLSTQASRAKLLKSGTGIILALVVIAVFILIATWLSSLLFGVMLAYLFLPLEQFFERKLAAVRPRSRSGKAKTKGFWKKLRRSQVQYEISESEKERRAQHALTTRATTLTVSCVVTASIVLFIAVLMLLNHYVGNLHKDISGWVKEQRTAVAAAETTVEAPPQTDLEATVTTVLPPEHANTQPMAPSGNVSPTQSSPEELTRKLTVSISGYLTQAKNRFQETPLVQKVLEELNRYLSDEAAQQELGALILRKSGGFFAFLAKFIAGFASFLLNLLLTFFFFSLILSKLADFQHDSGNAEQRSSNYLVRTIFNGKWLPAMSEENLKEGDRIIGETFNKLRIWLRGYLTMISIDFCVYTLVFILLGVPYAPILGLIAGLGILLPYIGPVSSAVITVLVTLAVGGSAVSGLQIAGIIGIYCLHNGIVEQFFIYPWIIGESLGLSTLETIIVVLLGGILAGIPGMIFALPASAVLKYLIPQIYHCWK